MIYFEIYTMYKDVKKLKRFRGNFQNFGDFGRINITGNQLKQDKNKTRKIQ